MISVMIPVCNAEPYLRRCLDSVLNSACRDFELILVNDGSSDQSPAICREYPRPATGGWRSAGGSGWSS